jgi:hypothetical protein
MARVAVSLANMQLVRSRTGGDCRSAALASSIEQLTHVIRRVRAPPMAMPT